MKKQILIVEDEIIIAKDIKQVLMNFGFDISSMETTGKNAIKAVESHPPDLVLMDISLEGDMDGIEAARQIHSRYNIPVVYMTANKNLDILERARFSEPYAVLIKPCDHRELYTHIEIALHKHQVEKRLAHLNSVLKAIKNINQLIVREKKGLPLMKGVCNLLIETDSCNTAWIAASESPGNFTLAAHSGTYEEFRLLTEVLASGQPPACIKKALNLNNVLVTTVHNQGCQKCPVHKFHQGKGTMAARLKYDEKIYGVLNVSIASEFVNLKEEKELIKEVADDIAFALHKIDLEKERKQLEEQLHTAAITDELTGLYNRRGFFTLSEQQHKLAIRTKGKLSLLYLDLDNLKTINDLYGHKAGDEALVDTAEVLKSTFRQSDIIGRIGGDEFAVLLIEPQGGDVESVVTENINKKLQAHNQQNQRQYHLSLSMGMAYFDPESPYSIGDLLIKADAAMYEEKKYHRLRFANEKLFPDPGRAIPKKRRFPRFEVYNYWSSLPGGDSCEIKNISLGGMCLKTSQKLPINKIYNFKIFPAVNGGKTLKGKVVWSSSNGSSREKKSTTSSYEAGLEFISLNDLQANSLNLLIGKITH